VPPCAEELLVNPLPTKNIGFGATDLVKESEALLSVSCTPSGYKQASSRIEIAFTTIDRLPSGIAERIRANFS
jgi:hypothetical protein